MDYIKFIRTHARENFILVSLLLLILFFSLASDNFFSFVTLKTILNQLPALTIVTVGMTLVLIVGGIDLSVGSVLGFSATVVGVALLNWGLPLYAACLLGIGAGLLCGFMNGILVAYLSLPSFIVTLGMLEMARGLAYITTNSQTMYIGASIQKLALPIAGTGVSVALIFALTTVIAGQFILTKTVLGRYITATGTNTQAARMSGINTRLYRLLGTGRVRGSGRSRRCIQRRLPRVSRSECRFRSGTGCNCRGRYRRHKFNGGTRHRHRRIRRRPDRRGIAKRTGADRSIRTGKTPDNRGSDNYCCLPGQLAYPQGQGNLDSPDIAS